MTQPHSPVSSRNVGEGEEGGSVSPEDRAEIRVRLFARTDVGQVREHNEDNFLVADLTRRQRGLMEANRRRRSARRGPLFAVCDGMGGAAAGEIASQLAVDIVCEKMIEGLDDSAAVGRDELGRRLVRAVEAAGLRIFQEAKVDRTRRGMGTTVTAAALVDDILFLAQVGDSRGYILRNGTLTQVTRDQSLVNQLIEAGQLTEEEAETFEHNNIILQALGTSDTVQVDLTYVELRQGDILLLCSDGLSGMVRFDEIREVLRIVGRSARDVQDAHGAGESGRRARQHHRHRRALRRRRAEAPHLGRRAAQVPQVHASRRAHGSDRIAPASGLRELAAATAGGSLAPGKGGMPSNLYAPANPSVPPVRSGGPPARSAPPGSGIASSVPAGPWHEQGPHAEDEERISIPGTHVPAWVVVALVLCVVAMLCATAFLLLR